jgi:hypothetical protein
MNDPFDIGIDCTPEFRPNMISYDHMPLLFKDVPQSVKSQAKELLAADWKIYAVKQNRGRCYYRGKAGVITIPVWAIERAVDYKVWYICHEMSHALDKSRSKHGPEFMRILQDICPAESVHYELGYKPRNAAAAGIRKPGLPGEFIDPFDLL